MTHLPRKGLAWKFKQKISHWWIGMALSFFQVYSGFTGTTGVGDVSKNGLHDSMILTEVSIVVPEYPLRAVNLRGGQADAGHHANHRKSQDL